MAVPRYSYFVLAVLLLVYIMNQWHRYLFNYLSSVATPECSTREGGVCFVPKGQTTVPLCDVCPTPGAGGWLNCEACHACLRNHSAARYNLQEGTCINEAQYGLLAGFGFSLLFVVAGLFAGRLADIANRRNVIALSLLAWSAATAGMGLAHNFGGLLSARVAQGVGQAFAAPASYSLIADYFPSEYRATANGLYAFGVYVGGGLSSLSLLLATWMGWRLTVMLVGGLGVLLSACVLAAVREPARAAAGAPAAASVSASASAQQEEEEGGGGGGRDALLPKLGEAPRGGAAAAPAPVSLGQAIRTVAQSREVMLLFVAAALRFVGGYSIAAFLPIYFKRQFPGQNKQYSLFNAGVVSVGGALSAYAGGWLADRWSRRTPRARAWVPALGAVLGFLPFIATMYSGNFYVAMAGLFFEYLFAECWFGPALAILQNTLPANVRGMAVAMYLFVGTLVGNAAPAVIGAMDDGSTAQALRPILFGAVALSYLGCGVAFAVLGMLIRVPPAEAHALLPK